LAKRGSKAGRRVATGDPNPFTAFEYYAYADQFYDAFHKLGADHLHPSISWPRYFMLCHTIELALKAYLAKLGATPRQLRQLERRHDLDRLVTEAIEQGLHLTRPTQDRIRALAEAHAKYWHRYPRDDGKTKVYTIEQFIRPAHELMNAVCKEVHGVSWEELERSGSAEQ
jgi:hypothetical protein